MRALVTGATGFLGTNLVHRLLAEGDEVRVLVRSVEKAGGLIERGAEPVVGDITDQDTLAKALRGIDLVYHMAGKLLMPGVAPADYYRTHVEGTRALLECCRKTAHIQRLVHCSTTGVLGVTGDKPAAEDAPSRPTNVYEHSKWRAELLVRDAIQAGFPISIVRPGLVYGPGDLHLLGFFRSIERGLFRPIGWQPVWLHPIYVDDLVEAVVRCGEHPAAGGQCFNIAGIEPVTVANLASMIAAALGKSAGKGRIPLAAAKIVALIGDALPDSMKSRAPLTTSRLDFLTHSRVYDVSKARERLGFVAATDLRAGIRQTVTWYRSGGHLLKTTDPEVDMAA